MATTLNTIPTKRLATTIDGTASLLKVNNILDWSGTDLTSAYLGDKLYAVCRDSDNTVIEIMELDPTTIANNATVGITILRRGLKFNGDLTTEVTANKLVWVKNQTIVELGSDVPQIFQTFVNVNDPQTIAGIKTFSSVPVTTGGNPINANDLARKAYVDTVVAGIATSVSEVVPGTAGETLVAGNLVYLKTSDNRWWKTSASTASTVDNVLLGIAQGAGTAGVAVTNGIMIRGVDTNQSGRVAGEVQYASNTSGAIANTPGTTEVTVGVAKSATELYFDPRFNQQLTEDQQDALAGTSGTPSATNKFVTNDDTSGTGSVVRSSALASLSGSWFGDGGDGDATIAAGTTTISRDMYYNNLTIQTGGTLNPSGYRVFVAGTLAFQGTGKIARNGNDGSVGTAGTVGASGGGGGAGGNGGAALASANLYGGEAGGNGGAGGGGTTGTGQNGTSGTQATTPSGITNAVGSTASAGTGAGGNSGGAFNGNSGGSGGAAGTGGTTVTNPTIMPRTVTNAISLHTLINATAAFMKGSAGSVGGSGGGGGAGGNQGAGFVGGGGGGGGGAGSTGGVVMVAAKTVTGGYATCIQAIGGAGGNGGNGANPTTQFAGGGGSGGGGNGGTGGVVCFVYNSYTGTALSTACVAGGAAGAAGTTAGIAGTGGGSAGSLGSAGAAGATGKLYTFAV